MIERLARHPAGDCSVSVEAAPAGRTNMSVWDALESIIRRYRIRNALSMRIEESLLRPHANNLTLVRLVLASSVIYTHCYWALTGRMGEDDLSAFLGAPISVYAVDGFFFLSGFLVFASLQRSARVGGFLLARVARSEERGVGKECVSRCGSRG